MANTLPHSQMRVNCLNPNARLRSFQVHCRPLHRRTVLHASYSGTIPVPAEVSDIPRQPSNFVYQVDILQPPSQLALARRLLQVTAASLQFGAILVGNDLSRMLLNTEGGKEASAQSLQKLLTRLGPTFVKLAQTLSMRPDLVGDVYASALTKLQDNVKPFPNDAAFAILEEELGRPAGEVFEFLSPDPVASASIGQVYRGVLRPEFGGTNVAVKVQRPGASESIALDIFLLRRLLAVVQRAAGITRNLGVLADEIGVALRGECDFRNEVANSEVFQKAHAALGFITTPPAIPELCSRRLLISQWIDGRSPTQLLTTEGAGASDVLSMVRMGIQCSLVQLLVTGCMHGDPHSGNLLLMPDGRLCYLDFGMIVRVSSEHRQAMMAALVHLGLGEWSRLVDDLDNLELLKEGTDKALLAKELEVEFTAVLAGGEAGSDGTNSNSSKTSAALAKQLPLLSLQTSSLSFSILAAVLFRVAYKFRFLLPSYFPLVVRAVASLEGVALTVDPNFKLVAAGMPVVLNQLLSDRRPAAQELLRELLLVPGGALRTDDTTRQVLQVWLSAAKQEARAEIISANGGSVDLEHDPAAAAATQVSASAAAVDMTSLLLDRKNVPLRKTLMMSNPAATVAEMPPEMRADLLKVLSEALTSGEVTAAASGLLKKSPAARAQRKRLWMLFTASVPKVLNSPPKSILQLITFTMTVFVAVTAALFRKWIAKFVAMWGQWFGGGGGKKSESDDKPQTQSA
jgi:aarF domain-containing kinase